MQRTAAVVLALYLLLGLGCAMRKAAAPPPPGGYTGIAADDPNRLQESLFKGDQEVLSNQDIERILSSRVDLSDRRRLVVLGLNPRIAWSQDIAALDAQHAEQFLQALASADQLKQVRVMPSLLVPEKRTVPYLREAAARFQADLLLVYTARVRTFQRDRFIGSDEVNADCTAESVLIDVRSGIVVHTASALEHMASKKSPSDLNFAQTVAKAESDATGRALLRVAESVVTFCREAAK